ncbi:MAG TPA: hypothetical protein VKM55_30170 [Candidatus Lokiarchaeia archaeon]|nr:hypothetical protein [Candidatus Lokiarchaeia archaeon]
MDITVSTVVSFIIAWLIFTFAVWGGGAIFQKQREWNRRGFGTSLIMALVVLLAIWLLWPILPSSWALWIDILIAFVILLICFAIFWGIGFLRALGASIICLLLLWLILWIISAILAAMGISYVIPLI